MATNHRSMRTNAASIPRSTRWRSKYVSDICQQKGGSLYLLLPRCPAALLPRCPSHMYSLLLKLKLETKPGAAGQRGSRAAVGIETLLSGRFCVATWRRFPARSRCTGRAIRCRRRTILWRRRSRSSEMENELTRRM